MSKRASHICMRAKGNRVRNTFIMTVELLLSEVVRKLKHLKTGQGALTRFVFGTVLRKLLHPKKGTQRELMYSHYSHCEFSFDDSPGINIKKYASTLGFKSCFKPHVDDDDDDDDMCWGNGGMPDTNAIFMLDNVDEEINEVCIEDAEVCDCDEGIDEKAEQFINKFYKEMKKQQQQQQISNQLQQSNGTF